MPRATTAARLLDAYDALVAALAAERALEREIVGARHRFQERTGKFVAEDAWFEARSRAFWDYAVTRPGLAVQVASSLPEHLRPLVPGFERAHRGLFVVAAAGEPDGAGHLLRDLWSGIEIAVDDAEAGVLDALDAASAPFDARVVATFDGASPCVALLPGAVFHPDAAEAEIAPLLLAAREARMATDDVLDALLRMDRMYQSLARVKPAYAYRVEALR